MMGLSKWIAPAVAIALFATSRVDAQLNPAGNPNFGSVKLKTGFLPDPYKKELVAGGDLEVTMGGVKHHVTANPDFKLYYTAGNVFPLTIHAKSKGDTTLIVNLPNGKYVSNDDGGKGLNPRLHWDKPTSGRYDIWVGTYGKKNIPATLYITELPDDNVDPKPKPKAKSVEQLDISLKPRYGEVTLKAGFLPDPHKVKLQAGGNLTVNFGGVHHHVMKNPDYKLHYTKGSYKLTFYVQSAGDTTLLINLPNGSWTGDDDKGAGLNAQIKLNTPMSGRYDIYVGTFGAKVIPATLNITELK